MTTAIHTGQPGRPRILTEEVEKRLVDATELGVPVAIAAQAAGVSPRAFQVWCARGRDEEEHRDNGGEPRESEELYFELWQKITQARARAASRSVLQIQKVAQGGIVIEETTERDPDGTERTIVKRSAPDWRAAAWYLERQHRQHFGKEPTQVELTGADGGPVQLSGAQVEDLAGRLTANIKALTAAATAALPPGGDDHITDAEIVET